MMQIQIRRACWTLTRARAQTLLFTQTSAAQAEQRPGLQRTPERSGQGDDGLCAVGFSEPDPGHGRRRGRLRADARAGDGAAALQT